MSWQFTQAEEARSRFEARGISQTEVDAGLATAEGVRYEMRFGDTLIVFVAAVGERLVAVHCDLPTPGVRYGVVLTAEEWKE